MLRQGSGSSSPAQRLSLLPFVAYNELVDEFAGMECNLGQPSCAGLQDSSSEIVVLACLSLITCTDVLVQMIFLGWSGLDAPFKFLTWSIRNHVPRRKKVGHWY